MFSTSIYLQSLFDFICTEFLYLSINKVSIFYFVQVFFKYSKVKFPISVYYVFIPFFFKEFNFDKYILIKLLYVIILYNMYSI